MTFWWHAGLCWGQGDQDECMFVLDASRHRLQMNANFRENKGSSLWPESREFYSINKGIFRSICHWSCVNTFRNVVHLSIEKSTFWNPSRAFLAAIPKPLCERYSSGVLRDVISYTAQFPWRMQAHLGPHDDHLSLNGNLDMILHMYIIDTLMKRDLSLIAFIAESLRVQEGRWQPRWYHWTWYWWLNSNSARIQTDLSSCHTRILWKCRNLSSRRRTKYTSWSWR